MRVRAAVEKRAGRDAAYGDDPGKAGVPSAVDGAASESLGQAHRRQDDRELRFREYEDGKLREAHGGGWTAAGAQDAPASTQEPMPEPAAPQRKKLFSEIPTLTGERIVLDRVVDTDAEALADLIQNQNVQRYLPTYLFEKQHDDVREPIRLMYGDLFQNKESLILAIRMKETGELAGLFEFYGLRDRLHKISVGYRLREGFWGRGVATEAARLAVGYLYGETDIEIITASVMVENIGSARVLEKCDFIRTARYVEEDWGFPEPTIVDKWFC